MIRPQFHNSDDAKKALEQLNGFELAGRPMKVNHVTERSETQQGSSLLDSDEMERAGIDLGKIGERVLILLIMCIHYQLLPCTSVFSSVFHSNL